MQIHNKENKKDAKTFLQFLHPKKKEVLIKLLYSYTATRRTRRTAARRARGHLTAS